MQFWSKTSLAYVGMGLTPRFPLNQFIEMQLCAFVKLFDEFRSEKNSQAFLIIHSTFLHSEKLVSILLQRFVYCSLRCVCVFFMFKFVSSVICLGDSVDFLFKKFGGQWTNSKSLKVGYQNPGAGEGNVRPLHISRSKTHTIMREVRI